jgi:hypothetical protein
MGQASTIVKNALVCTIAGVVLRRVRDQAIAKIMGYALTLRTNGGLVMCGLLLSYAAMTTGLMVKFLRQHLPYKGGC